MKRVPNYLTIFRHRLFRWEVCFWDPNPSEPAIGDPNFPAQYCVIAWTRQNAIRRSLRWRNDLLRGVK